MDIEDANKSVQPTPWDVACFFLEGRPPGAADFHRYATLETTMSHINRDSSVLHQAEQLYIEEEKKIAESKEWCSFEKASNSLHKAAHKGILPFDPKFNAVHWAFNVSSLCQEIVIGYCWMQAHAKLYKEKVGKGSQPAHADFHVSYYADNCITRIDSSRDKLALMIWAYYCPFNPEKKDETPDYQKIVDRLKYPVKFGITLKNHTSFLRILEDLKGLGRRQGVRLVY